VGDERDEFVLDPTRFEQLLVLQCELTLGGLRLVACGLLGAPETVERPDQPGEPDENQRGERRRSDRKRYGVDRTMGQVFDQEKNRRGRDGCGEHDQPSGAEPWATRGSGR